MDINLFIFSVLQFLIADLLFKCQMQAIELGACLTFLINTTFMLYYDNLTFIRFLVSLAKVSNAIIMF